MANDELIAPRRLTDAESSQLRSLLKSQLHLSASQQAEEDANDLLDYALAMIANGKTVGYVKEELTSMEMEVCDVPACQKLGSALSTFLQQLILHRPNEPNHTRSPNALENSGALGVSRERNVVERKNRTLHGMALDRLRQQAHERGNRGTVPQRMIPAGRRGGESHGPPPPPRPPIIMNRDLGRRGLGRDVRGGRGMVRDIGSEAARGRGGQRTTVQHISGRRRERDEENFMPMASQRNHVFAGRGVGPLRAGRGRMEGRGRGVMESRGRGREFLGGPRGDNRHSFHQGNSHIYDAKRIRYEEPFLPVVDMEPHVEESPYIVQESRGKPSFGRGGQRGGRGRFSSGFTPDKSTMSGIKIATATEQAAAVSESPLIAASFGHAVTNYKGRGQGRLRNGRGLAAVVEKRPGRAEVMEMISAKTWVRPRTVDEGLSTKR